MENQLISQKRGLLQKIPDIKNALQALDFVTKKQVTHWCFAFGSRRPGNECDVLA